MPDRLLHAPAGASLSAIPTDWARLKGLDDPTEAEREAKWAYVVATYQAAIDRYLHRVLRRGLGFDPEPGEVEDVRQGFLEACVEKRWLSRADPVVGRFRAFLQAVLKRYACNYLDHRNALKRRPAKGSHLVALDDLVAVGADPAAEPEAHEFDEGWVHATVRAAVERLRRKNARYAEVVERLLADRGDATEPRTTADRVLDHRARKAFRKHFEETLRATVMWDAFLAEEWVAIERLLP